jgi:membrane protease YdiL (CAAX protease family)
LSIAPANAHSLLSFRRFAQQAFAKIAITTATGLLVRLARDMLPARLPAMAITPERKSAIILGSFAAIECSWVAVNLYFNGWRFVRYLGFAPGLTGGWAGWLAAAAVVAIFVGYSRRLPSVRENLLRPSFLKLVALALAVGAGILEEVMFRRWCMNWLMAHGFGAFVQILGAGLLFGAVHAIWGLMGKSLSAAMGAMLATGFLGAMLGIVFLLAGRSLAPCIAAHFLINAFIEPGLVLAATRGEMGRR